MKPLLGMFPRIRMNNRARKQPNASMLVSCHGLVVTSDRSREEVTVPLLHLLARHARSIFTKIIMMTLYGMLPCFPEAKTSGWHAGR
jgi:flagellar biosynthesis component FlhA